jgi:hypothetical protein
MITIDVSDKQFDAQLAYEDWCKENLYWGDYNCTPDWIFIFDNDEDATMFKLVFKL